MEKNLELRQSHEKQYNDLDGQKPASMTHITLKISYQEEEEIFVV